MKFSKNWLQEYIVETLPEDGVIEAELNAKAFEVEGVEAHKDDSVFDIKVLPNRAHDALGHYGMAVEICACLGLTIKNKSEIFKTDFNFENNVETVDVEVLDTKACNRFMAVRIDGVSVGDSPEWLRMRLESIGQRSINNIVDITNFVQFTLNKPMHAYDAKNIDGGIVVRYANEGEKLTTLDDKELTLNTKTLVIADKAKALGLAGIKGGKYSGINSDTTSIVIESANFDPVLIRKTSQKYDIRTDASKRFENGIANILVEDGLMMTVSEILKMFPNAKIGAVTDTNSTKETGYSIGITTDEINSILGSDYKEADVLSALNKLNFKSEKINTKNYILENYKKLIGAEYKNPSSMRLDAPKYFSCSSLVSYLFKGVWMPSLSIDKYVFSKKINETDLVFGDLVFANSGEGKIRFESVEFLRGTKVEAGVDHVGIYLGDNNVLHATKKMGCVTVETLQDFKSGRTVTGYGRVCDDLDIDRILVNIPSERLDIRLKEDLVEEVGRIIGYDKLVSTLPKLEKKGKINKRLYYQNIVRNILCDKGFSEVITYSFVEKGEVTLAKSASDKNRLRTNISDGLTESLNKNINNMPLLNIDHVAIFEFGNCFTNSEEWTSFAMAIDDGKKKSNFADQVDMILGEVKKVLGAEQIEFEKKNNKPYIIELNFDELIKSLPEPTSTKYLDENLYREVKYKTFSVMPFVVRDVAFWADADTNKKEIENLIQNKAGNLCISINLFDEFTKENRTSYGFRLVYQDRERTLTDEEVNGYADNVYAALKEKGYEIR